MKNITFTAAQVEALKYYLEMRCPDLLGHHEFKTDKNAGTDEPVTWVNIGFTDPTDVTKAEFKKLEKGAETLGKLKAILGEALSNKSGNIENIVQDLLEALQNR